MEGNRTDLRLVYQETVYRFVIALLVAIVAPTIACADARELEWTEGADSFLETLVNRQALLLIDANAGEILETARPLLKRANSLKGPEFFEAGRKESIEIKKEAVTGILEFLEQSPETIRVDLASGSRPLGTVGPIALSGDKDCLVFRIDSGTAEIRLEHCRLPMALESDRGGVSIEVSPCGVTWVVMDLTGVPKGQTYFLVKIARTGHDFVRLPVLVETPAHARLAVSVLSEETGEPTPFMVSLRWGRDDSPRRPPNAVDLADQFESNRHALSLRKARLPGRLEGEYWCVPGPFDMTLPPGEWKLIVRRGLEFAPVIETFHIGAGETVTKEYTLRQWAKMSDKGWYSGDDHVHLRIVSDADAKAALTWAKAEGVRLSNILEMGDIAGTYFYQRGFGKDYRVEEDGYYLVPGEEDPRTHHELGHTIRLNNQTMVRFPEQYFLYDVYYDAVHEQGGLSGFAHVNTGLFHIVRSMTLNAPSGKIDFVEVFQFADLGTQLFYEFLNLGFPMTLSAGSDVPWGGTIGEQRVYVHLGDRQFDPDSWFDAFAKGRTFVTNGPMLEFAVSDAMPGETLPFTGTEKFRVKARAWGDPERFLPTRLDLVRLGETIASATNTEGSLASLELEFDLEESESCWLAIRAQGDDGSIAHTTPIYLVRDSRRFWKRDQVPNLIAKRFQDLQEIEDFVTEAADRIDQGGNLLDTHSWQYQALSAQAIHNSGPELLRRVGEAREFYSGLLRAHEEATDQSGGNDRDPE